MLAPGWWRCCCRVGRCVVTNVGPTPESDLHVSVVDVEVGQVGSRVERNVCESSNPNPGLLIPYGGSAVKSAELTLRLATEDTDVLECQGHYSMAMVCRRSSVSTSFMLAALRVLHVDVSN